MTTIRANLKFTLIIAALSASLLSACGPGVIPSTTPKALDAAVILTATPSVYVPGPLDTGTEFTTVTVTVTNGATGDLPVNPLYFSAVGTDGSVHECALMVGATSIAAVTLGAGEHATGEVTFKGAFTPAKVKFTNAILITIAEADVK